MFAADKSGAHEAADSLDFPKKQVCRSSQLTVNLINPPYLQSSVVHRNK